MYQWLHKYSPALYVLRRLLNTKQLKYFIRHILTTEVIRLLVEIAHNIRKGTFDLGIRELRYLRANSDFFNKLLDRSITTAERRQILAAKPPVVKRILTIADNIFHFRSA